MLEWKRTGFLLYPPSCWIESLSQNSQSGEKNGQSMILKIQRVLAVCLSVYSLVLGDYTNNRSAAERKHHNQGNFTKRSLFRTMVSEGSEFIMEKKL